MADIFRSQADKSEDPPRTSLRALLPLIPYALRYKGQILGALGALTVASIATLTVPVAVKGMIDHGFSGEGAQHISRYFLAMLAVVAVLAVASGLRYFFVMVTGERVVADLRSDVFAHLSRLDAAFFDGARTGELLSRLTADTTQMKAAFGASASVALRNLFMFAGAVAMMVYTSPKLSGLVLVAIPIIVFPLVASGRGVRRRSRRAQDTLAEASAFAAENLSAVRTMQASNAQPGTLRRFAAAVEDAYAAARDTTAARSILTVVAIFLAFSSVIAVLWLGAQDVLAGRMSAGQLSQFVLYAVFGASSLGQLSEVWSEISQAAGAAGRLAEILAIQPKIVAPQPCLALPQPAQGSIAFDDVHFAYPSRPDAQALKGLSFSIAPGETVALVGPSGAGKSTVFQLLLRFYDPQSGVVRVDGVDVAKADPSAVRARIALVPQEPVIFSGTIGDNIRYGSEDAPQEKIADAARRAAADEFIRVLPEGYESRVGERGVTLSGGQKQRLAIARAILRDAPVLLLDEATSALDAENERLVQGALENIMGTRTTIVIAHRLATVLKADRILVMEGGRIVEEGTHATLVARGGLYARLARLQFDQPDVRAAE
ncbi:MULTISPECIES: ABC transporter transmembrane domain-containing protein [unclassified Beijerinckia]|uniref:ABC transporter transmembrane domain-containing protein n=1 Tax=unclassified Beijerinckia TaxID=2638183 RepID=UPI0008988BC5|nr:MULTISPECIES: ABC transporter transmembrane domain-containing protein [unclassified Beijerinckia]MDH7799351.1 ATP-binding cassette subfamily B protein [Beijerinckia sp. GAS462]SED47245.1 ATP-binding cassette, subfamily B [Beijerinckia sp. 28-YEA-48]